MIISNKYRFIYIDVPKTGSTSMEKWLIENFNGRQVGRRHCRELPNKDYRRFTLVRHPYPRFLSAHNAIRQAWLQQLKPASFKIWAGLYSPEELVEYLLATDPLSENPIHLGCQTQYAYLKAMLPVDVYKLEDIEEVCVILADKYSCDPGPFPHERQASYTYRGSDRLYQLINIYAAYDFKEFGYV